MSAAAQGLQRLFGLSGGLCCAAAVGLSAFAMHGAQGAEAQRAAITAAFLFGHGLAFLLLAPRADGWLKLAALLALALGLALFCGSLLGALFFGTPTALAPGGGVLLMLGWGLFAFEALFAGPGR